MPTFELRGYNTDSRYQSDIRYREYTTSKRRADLFAKIPKIQFTDSGHGIVFCAIQRDPRFPSPRGKPVRVVADWVNKHLRELEAANPKPPPKRMGWKLRALDAERETRILKNEADKVAKRFCRNCYFWEKHDMPEFHHLHGLGLCEHPKMRPLSVVRQDGIVGEGQHGDMTTGPDFGCVHCEVKLHA